MLENAKALRSRQTETEQQLWYHLRARRFMGYKFKRQKPLGPYVVDFVCLKRKLVIELDGGQHADSITDQHRDDWLRNQGYTVLRFWNNEIAQQLESVWERVHSVLSSPPTPSPAGGRGEEAA